MKLAILGGGGFRTPWVHRALLGDTGHPRVTEVVLQDTDPDRLRAMELVLSEDARTSRQRAPVLSTTTDLDTAVAGSDFVFAAIRVGGLAGRVADERVALDLGVLGQETTGPGGLAYGLRTVPVMRHVAERVRDLAPNAWVMNFTNPAGMITEAMQDVLGERVLGICDTPSGLGRRAALLLGVDPAAVSLDYVGLNHLGWLRGLRHRGADLLPRLIGDPGMLRRLEEGAVFGPEWVRSLGVLPNEYLWYYTNTREAVRSILASGQTRGEFLQAQQGSFYADLLADPTDAVARWRDTIDARSAAYMAEAKAGRTDDVPADPEGGAEHRGYAGVALAVVRAISRGEPATLILNVRNGTVLRELPADAVIEVPTLVDANGVHPLATAPPELWQAGLMAQVKTVEQLVIRAALTGDADTAVRAFATHPLVDSLDVARRLLAGYRARIPEVEAVFARRA